MKVKELKELLKDLSEDTIVVIDGGPMHDDTCYKEVSAREIQAINHTRYKILLEDYGDELTDDEERVTVLWMG